MKKVLRIGFCFGIVLLAAGCSNFERTTFQSLSASKVVIDQAQADYESGTLPHTTCVYTLVNSAKAAQTLGVNAMLDYESAKAANGNLAVAEASVVTDLGSIATDITAVKVLYTNPKCGA
jgi:hypothetical protein